jgi:hypothetical protein
MIRMMTLRRVRWAGHVARMKEKRNAYRILLIKPQGKRRPGRPRITWVDNEIAWGDMDWIDLAQDRNNWRAFMKTVMNLRVL